MSLYMRTLMELLVLTVILILPASIFGGKTTPCEDNWVAFQGSCYLFGHDDLHFLEAQRSCEHHDAHLVHINDATENAFIKSFLMDLKAGEHWIGLTDDVTEDIWKWYDTDKVATYFNWNPGQPNQGKSANCVAIFDGYNYNWVDDPCTNSFKALCEKTPHTETEVVG